MVFIPDVDILNTLEWTKHLDDIWIKNKNEDHGLTWQYFGSMNGVLRIYPGEHTSSNQLFLHDFVHLCANLLKMYIEQCYSND